MRKTKIVADSSANLMTMNHVDFDAAPLKIITAEKEFVDDKNLGLCSYYAERGGMLVGYEKF